MQGHIDDIKRADREPRRDQGPAEGAPRSREAIQKLQTARTGPTSTLLELAHILTPGRGPTIDRDKLEQLKRDNPKRRPNANWDPRRLWLTAYQEADRTVKLGGLARDGEDVSEFQRRLRSATTSTT